MCFNSGTKHKDNFESEKLKLYENKSLEWFKILTKLFNFVSKYFAVIAKSYLMAAMMDDVS